ncbi:MAG: radical SAM protein [Candidatus Aminicenantes bacterium]|nr:radical SAM protein [Candidatus Aminicenantes bacterium]
MKDVLLLNPPGDKQYIRDFHCSFSSKADYYWPSPDLVVLSGLLDEAFRVGVMDAILDKISAGACLERILRGRYGAVIFTTGTATLKSDLALAAALKAARPETKIVASAGILKFEGRRLLAGHPALDACLTDYADPELEAYLRGERGRPLRGLIYRNGGGFVASEGTPEREFTVPVPRHDLFAFRKFRNPVARRLPFTVVVTSIGCPYRCGFCAAGAWGYRTRPVDNILPELRFLGRLGVKEILFLDPTLTVGAGRVIELCRSMVSEGLRFTWSGNADVRTLTEEKVSWMKKAGCHTVFLGIESGDDGLLKRYGKPVTADRARRTVDLLNRHGLRTLGYFILGLPGETRDMALKTIALARSLKLDIASFAFATPDIGTPLREEAMARGWIPPDLDVWDSTERPLINSGDMTPREVEKLRRRAVRSFYLRPSYVLRKLLQARSAADFVRLASNALALLKKK